MYIGIGYILAEYILPTIGDIFLYWVRNCQQLADIFWYWIYSANNWGIYSDIGYILQQLADIFSSSPIYSTSTNSHDVTYKDCKVNRKDISNIQYINGRH